MTTTNNTFDAIVLSTDPNNPTVIWECGSPSAEIRQIAINNFIDSPYSISEVVTIGVITPKATALSDGKRIMSGIKVVNGNPFMTPITHYVANGQKVVAYALVGNRVSVSVSIAQL